MVGDETYVLHLVPSGILHEGKLNVIAGGVAVDPATLLGELDGLAERGVEIGPDRLQVAAGAHVIFEHHRRIDHAAERWRGEGRIGTTGRGIGPCYADKAARTGIRVADLLEPERRRERLRAALAEKNALLSAVHGEEPLELGAELARCTAVAERLRPFVADTGAVLRRAYREEKSILFEGAQGAMLDLDHGTYPFVTSSSTGVNGIGPGAGFPAGWVDRAVGIAKAYCTRVGEGPFPSEDAGETGQLLRDRGHEYGATTGRPRRCGWFDAVAARYALELNGADAWVVTNLDVLTGFAELPVVVAYARNERRFDEYPADLPDLGAVDVIRETHPGWVEDIGGVRHYGDLPPAARSYVEWLERLVGVPIAMLSVGPERDQVIPKGELL